MWYVSYVAEHKMTCKQTTPLPLHYCPFVCVIQWPPIFHKMNQGKIPVLYAGKYSMYVKYKNSVVTAYVMDDQNLIPKIGRNMNKLQH